MMVFLVTLSLLLLLWSLLSPILLVLTLLSASIELFGPSFILIPHSLSFLLLAPKELIQEVTLVRTIICVEFVTFAVPVVSIPTLFSCLIKL